ncbi:hypothetical protein [Campylobacter sputorum]|uniref:hypothetical protein n=1 Tax=Campylobacter sputorum TaxID=206 RepID=UPI000B7785D6|nr:hypothetical protein [Campylobacter sputorum]ASM37186.1 hypothetical protein CSF_1335 [Campylobacter sputorum bv. faecalis CCUG 20703]ASM38852.1 hypothetical protein CSPARA_1305 [Campylobacter sputorum bv. paraureolyticus LMG 11764]
MTITLKNVDNDFLKVLESLVKIKKDIKIIKEKDLDYSQKIEKVINEFELEQKTNKTKKYNNFDEFEKFINA